MQKGISLIVIILLSYTAQAQLGIHIGGNISFPKEATPAWGAAADDIQIGVAGGAQVGVSYDIGRMFIFQPALYLQQKGVNYSVFNYETQTYSQIRRNSNHLELPLNFVVKLKITDQAKIYFGIGVSGSMFLWSKSIAKKTDTSWKDGYTSRYVTQFSDYDFTLGMQGFVGFQLYRFTATITYNSTFVAVNNAEKDRFLSLNIGYRIGRDKEKKQ